MSQKFNFFQTEKLDGVQTKEPLFGLQAIDVVASCSYKKTAFFGDSEGGLLYNDRSMGLHRIQMFDNSVNFMYHYSNSDYLILIGNGPDCRPKEEIEESRKNVMKYRENFRASSELSALLDSLHLPTKLQEGVSSFPSNYTIKVYKTIENKGDVELQLVKFHKIFDADPGVITCMNVFEANHSIVLGMDNGKTVILKGDVMSARPYIVFVLESNQLTEPITNTFMTFHEESGKLSILVTTLSRVGYYLIHDENKFSYEYRVITNEKGCQTQCAIMNSSTIIIGCNEGFFTYHFEDLYGCLVIPGKKLFVMLFKNYMIYEYIDQQNKAVVSIYNLTLKFFEKTMNFVIDGTNERIKACVNLNDVLFMLTYTQRLYQFKEYTIQNKLNFFFEQHLYTTAIELANQTYQPNEVIQTIYKDYGDYLYASGDFDGAMEQYLETIGTVEPSYVIQKYLDASTLNYLILYLEQLHTLKKATPYHTTLLIKCYSKSTDGKAKLDHFIHLDSNEFEFDKETAIHVLRSSNYFQEAAILASHDSTFYEDYISIVLNNLENYEEGLQTIHCLPWSLAINMMEIYGKLLIEKLPEQAIQLLIELCTQYVPQTSTTTTFNDIKDNINAEPADPIHFMNCFTSEERLIEFLELLLTKSSEWEDLVFNTLIELYLKQRENLIQQRTQQYQQEYPEATEDEMELFIQSNTEIVELEEKIMNILENKDYNYEDDQALLLVQMYGFKAGQLFLYTKKNMFPLILQHYIEKEDTEKVIEFCMEHGEEEHSLWINLLTYFSHMKKIDEKRLRSVLTYIEEHHIMPVLSVLDALSKCESITLDLMKDYILKELEESHNQQEQNRSYIDDLKKKNQEMSDEIIKLQTYPLFSNFFFLSCSFIVYVL